MSGGTLDWCVCSLDHSSRLTLCLREAHVTQAVGDVETDLLVTVIVVIASVYPDHGDMKQGKNQEQEEHCDQHLVVRADTRT